MKLSTIRKWKRDALEQAHDAQLLNMGTKHSTSPLIQAYERLATVCFLLERRMKDEDFARKIKERDREGSHESSEADSTS